MTFYSTVLYCTIILAFLSSIFYHMYTLPLWYSLSFYRRNILLFDIIPPFQYRLPCLSPDIRISIFQRFDFRRNSYSKGVDTVSRC